MICWIGVRMSASESGSSADTNKQKQHKHNNNIANKQQLKMTNKHNIV